MIMMINYGVPFVKALTKNFYQISAAMRAISLLSASIGTLVIGISDDYKWKASLGSKSTIARQKKVLYRLLLKVFKLVKSR